MNNREKAIKDNQYKYSPDESKRTLRQSYNQQIKLPTTMFANFILNAACVELHNAVIERGFTPQPVATNLMLIVSELGEACKADRKNNHADFDVYIDAMEEAMEEWGNTIHPERTAYREAFECGIKDSFEDKIADVFLRLMDLCGAMNIDIEKHIRMKAKYNSSIEKENK